MRLKEVLNKLSELRTQKKQGSRIPIVESQNFYRAPHLIYFSRYVSLSFSALIILTYSYTHPHTYTKHTHTHTNIQTHSHTYSNTFLSINDSLKTIFYYNLYKNCFFKQSFSTIRLSDNVSIVNFKLFIFIIVIMTV